MEIFLNYQKINPKSTYKVRLAEDGKFKMESQANTPSPDLNKRFY
jgi:hypothetical protein